MKGKSYIKILKTTLREHLLITNTKIDKLQLGNKNHCDHWRVNSESFFRWLAHTFALTNSSFFSICAFCYCLLLLLVAWDGTWKSFRFAGSLGLLKRNRSTSLGFMRGIFKGFFFGVGCLLFHSLLRWSFTTSIMLRYRLSRGQSMTDSVPMCLFFQVCFYCTCSVWDHCNLENWSWSNAFNFTRSPRNHNDT